MQESSGVLRDFMARLLETEGAGVEAIEPLGLEFIAPEALQQRLGLQEFGRLGFAAELPPGAERVSFESDWLDKLGRTMERRGRALRRVLRLPFETAHPVFSSPERMLEHALVLPNAVQRLISITPAWTRCLILTFRFTAMSDEKRDGLLHLAFNVATGSALDEFVPLLLAAAGNPANELNGEVPAGTSLPPFWPISKLAAALERGLAARVRASLAAFVKVMNRRLERDLQRIREYYEDLRQESLARLRKNPGDVEREHSRVDAIVREYGAKLADLQQKYAMRIDVEWVQSLELILPVQRFTLTIKRRKGERRLFLDWNPFARRMEPPPCEFSFADGTTRMICDERLHIVCLEAYSACGGCRREYCRACHPSRCPKCGTAATA